MAMTRETSMFRGTGSTLQALHEDEMGTIARTLRVADPRPRRRTVAASAFPAAALVARSSAAAADRPQGDSGPVRTQWIETRQYTVVPHGARNGVRFRTDRDCVFRNVPASLQGSDYVKIRQDDKHSDAGKAMLRLTLSRAATVTVGYDRRCRRIPPWRQACGAVGSWRLHHLHRLPTG